MATAHVEMHSEHVQWLGNYAMWRDDLALWRKEIDEAFDGLQKLEHALRMHDKGLQDQLNTILAEEQAVKGHEHALAEYERGGPGDDLLGMAKPHGVNAGKHAEQRRAHERLKERHHAVMAYWSLLLKTLAQKT